LAEREKKSNMGVVKKNMGAQGAQKLGNQLHIPYGKGKSHKNVIKSRKMENEGQEEKAVTTRRADMKRGTKVRQGVNNPMPQPINDGGSGKKKPGGTRDGECKIDHSKTSEFCEIENNKKGRNKPIGGEKERGRGEKRARRLDRYPMGKGKGPRERERI